MWYMTFLNTFNAANNVPNEKTSVFLLYLDLCKNGYFTFEITRK